MATKNRTEATLTRRQSALAQATNLAQDQRFRQAKKIHTLNGEKRKLHERISLLNKQHRSTRKEANQLERTLRESLMVLQQQHHHLHKQHDQLQQELEAVGAEMRLRIPLDGAEAITTVATGALAGVVQGLGDEMYPDWETNLDFGLLVVSMLGTAAGAGVGVMGMPKTAGLVIAASAGVGAPAAANLTREWVARGFLAAKASPVLPEAETTSEG